MQGWTETESASHPLGVLCSNLEELLKIRKITLKVEALLVAKAVCFTCNVFGSKELSFQVGYLS